MLSVHDWGAATDRIEEIAPNRSPVTIKEHREGAAMRPLYAARIEDLGVGDFVKVDCPACHHVALLPPEALLRAGLRPAAKVLRPQRAAALPRVRQEGAGGGLGEVAEGGRGKRRWPVIPMPARTGRSHRIGAPR